MTNGAAPVLVEESDGICRLTLNRPDKLNAIDGPMMEQLRSEFQRLLDDEKTSVVVLSGEGRAFCAGADVHNINAIYRHPDRARHFLDGLRDVVTGMERLPQPVIVSVQGVALAGGIELMLGADIVVAAESAHIGDQHMQRGFIPGGGSTQRLPRLMGRLPARDLLLTGRWLSAAEALGVGLVSRVVPDADLTSSVDELARSLAGQSRHAMAQVKRLARLAEEIPMAEALEMEINTVIEYYSHPEFTAGVESFLAGVKSSPQ